MELSLGHLYRYLSFEEAYVALGDPSLFDKILKAGWFPFVEVIGNEFEKLMHAYRDDFNINEQEQELLNNSIPRGLTRLRTVGGSAHA